MNDCYKFPTVAAVSLLYALLQLSAYAQTQAQHSICQNDGLSETECTALASEARLAKASKGLTPIGLNPLDNIGPFIQEHAASAYASVVAKGLKDKAEALALQAVSTRAAINQVGAASSSGSASTNLVSKPTTTDLISIASESGAFTDTLSGTSATIQANANGLAKLFTKYPVFSMETPSYASALQPLNFTVTLNVAQSTGTTTAPTSAGSSVASVLLPTNNASFSSFQVRYNIYRPNDPTSAAFHNKFLNSLTSKQKDIDAATADLTRVVQNIRPSLESNPEYSAARAIWIRSAAAAERSELTDFGALAAAYLIFKRDAYAALSTNSDFQTEILSMSSELTRIQSLANQAVDLARGTPLATLTYAYSRPTQQPATNRYGLVTSYLFKNGAELNANFDATIYVSKPMLATGSLRDLQMSGEFDKPFGGATADPRATWSLAGYGQYQYDPSILNITAGNLVPGTNISLPGDAQVLLGKAGWLGVVQGKLVINISKGMSVPVALKWSNRTELLDSTDIRGQFGISYDLSALSSLIAKGD